MKTIKVSEATNIQLDWLVAKCEGLPLRFDPMGFRREAPDAPQSGWWVWHGTPASAIVGYAPKQQPGHNGYSPTSDWSQMGPIIEREGINLSVHYQDDALSNDMVQIGWNGNRWNSSVPGTSGFLQWAYGPTPLIAAARCYAIYKLGEEVEVPEELP